jgi:hypothetical protein
MKIIRILLGLIVLLALPGNTTGIRAAWEGQPSHAISQADDLPFHTFLPQIQSGQSVQPQAEYRHNARFLPDATWLMPSSVFWFGKVTRTENYTDVRVGYTNTHLIVRIQVFDRMLWYDTTPTVAELEAYDAISLSIRPGGASGAAPDSNSFRFVAQDHPNYINQAPYRTTYRGNGSGWVAANIPFELELAYSGEGGFNQTGKDNRGWFMVFKIPFSSLGLSGKPADGTTWGLGVRMLDRDAAGDAIPAKTWPPSLVETQPVTWGTLGFGLPVYTAPAATNNQTMTIRQGLNAAQVPDVSVGGSTTCGEGTDFFATWGDKTESFYAGDTVNNTQFNIQNQSDVADFPCFAKYYVTFPLGALPKGKVIVSAKLILHQFGNSGAPGQAEDSLIHVMTAKTDWNESTLTWNNAPLAAENFAAAYVSPILGEPPFAGIAREWTISTAVARAYRDGQPLRLVLYSSDFPMHSGKYFWASNRVDDDQPQSRPSLVIVYGDPLP